MADRGVDRVEEEQPADPIGPTPREDLRGRGPGVVRRQAHAGTTAVAG